MERRIPTKEEIAAFLKDDNNWGRWGKDDQVGAVNMVTNEKRAAAARLVKTGRAVSLSREFPKLPAPNNPTPAHHFMKRSIREDTSGSATDYSSTNNQVANVDEADFVKNDGSFIYVLADGRFQVVDAWPATTAHLLSSFDIEGEPKRMFVHADRALVFSALAPLAPPATGEWGGPWGSYGTGDCTYGYDCEFTGDGHALKITVLDITDRSAPVLARELYLDGAEQERVA